MLALALVCALLQEDQALATFRKSYANPKAEDRSEAVRALGASHGPKVASALGEVIARDPAPEVRVIAARILGQFGDFAPKAAAILLTALGSNKDESVLAQIFKSLGELKEESAAPTVNRGFEAKETSVSEAAVQAAGAIRHRSSIEPLIELLLKLEREGNLSKTAGREATNGTGLKLPGSARTDSNKETQQRQKKLKPAVVRALQAIARERFATGRDWSDWWKKNAATFKVEK